MTQTEFTAILPAYVGCEITGDRIVNGSTFSCLMPEEDTYFTLYTEHPEYGQVRYKKRTPDSIKLVLRTDDQMTHKEEDEAEAYFQASRSIWKKRKIKFKNRYVSLTQMTLGINYLRSIGIDCDSLIENGYAIHKTK